MPSLGRLRTKPGSAEEEEKAQRAGEALNWQSETRVPVLMLTWVLRLHPVPEQLIGKISFHSLFATGSFITPLSFLF